MRNGNSFKRLMIHMMKYYVKPLLWFSLSLFILSGIGQPYVLLNSDALMKEKEVFQLVEASFDHSSEALRVMTYNIHHGRGMDGKVNLQRIGDVISSVEADIVFLQEVDRYHIRSGWSDQIKQLGEKLDMAWAYAPALQIGWTQYGNALLSRYPIESIEILKMPGKREPRNVLMAQLVVHEQPLYVFNTHLGLNAEERQHQLMLFGQWFEQLGTGDYRTLFAGDMNMTVDDPLLQKHEQYWYRLQVDEPTFYTGQQIDHIFTNQAVKVSHIETVSSDASDHYPLWADIHWIDSKVVQ